MHKKIFGGGFSGKGIKEGRTCTRRSIKKGELSFFWRIVYLAKKNYHLLLWKQICNNDPSALIYCFAYYSILGDNNNNKKYLLLLLLLLLLLFSPIVIFLFYLIDQSSGHFFPCMASHLQYNLWRQDNNSKLNLLWYISILCM